MVPSLYDYPSNEIWTNTEFLNFVDQISTNDTRIVKKSVANIQEFDTLLKNNENPNRLKSIFVESIDTKNNLYKYTLFVNSTIPDTLHVGMVLADTAILRLATNNPSA